MPPVDLTPRRLTAAKTAFIARLAFRSASPRRSQTTELLGLHAVGASPVVGPPAKLVCVEFDLACAEAALYQPRRRGRSASSRARH